MPSDLFSPTLTERFEAYHAEHPEVYELLRRLALEAVGRGHDRLGIKALWERARWEFYVGDQSGSDFRLNNDYTSLYARRLMDCEPALGGIFELRRRRSA